MPGMLFTLTGRDELSDVFDDIGDAARRMARRLHAASTDADREVRRFTRETSDRMAAMRRDTDAGGKAIEELGKVTKMLWPAVIPAAASLAPLAAGAMTVAVAVGAMGAALVPQISALSDVSEAQKKYDDAVTKSGATSQEAADAQVALQQAVSKLPPKTREAAASVGVLKDNYRQWSDSLAGDTMEPFIKGVEITNALLPKTSGLVKAASSETDRFLAIVGGEMAAPGLDRLNSKFTAFAQRTMRSVNDELVHLLRTSDSGEVGGKVHEFMDWARAQGPTVASVLTSVATALMHVLEAGSDVGVGLLQVVEVGARLVSAVPPEAIAAFLQLALALKVTKAAALGMAAGRTALAAFGAQLVAMRTAAAAVPGRLAAVRAAVLALSRTTKIAMAGTGIGLLIIGLSELAERSSHAPPDVDKLTSSLARLGKTGQVSGEASKAFGKDLDGLYGKVRSLTDPSTTDKVQQWIVSIGGLADWDSTPMKDAKENIGAVDDALAGLVQNGQADLAAAAVKRLTAEYGKGGRDTRKFTSELDDYRTAIADAKFEAELAADAQGIFGRQAMSVQEKLNAQKLSADGLRQSIMALSETSRNAFDAETKFEAAVDNVTKSLQDNGRTLDVGTDKGRANRDALSQMAAATEDAAVKARENGASWETVAGIWDKGRKTLVDNITAITGNRKEAERLASTLLNMPSPKMKLEMRTEDAIKGLDSVMGAIKKAPSSKSVTVKALTADAVGLLRDLGFKVQRMKDGRFKVTADTKSAKDSISAVQRARDGLKSKAIALSARDKASAIAKGIRDAIAQLRNKTVTITTVHHTLGAEGMAGRNNKNLNGYASGGTPRAGEVAMTGEEGPELVVFGQAARVFDAKTTARMLRGTTGAGQAASQGLAAGLGSTGGVYSAARAMAAAVTLGIKDEMEIASPSKKTKALGKDIGKGLIVGLTSTRDKIKATAKDLAGDIKKAFSGKKESALLKLVDKDTKKLLALAAKRDKIAAKIAEAKQYAKDTTRTARSSASLSNLGMEPGKVTAGGIKAGLKQKLAQIKQFSKYITTLAKRGLNKSLMREILDMGPVDGYAYASALVGADKATFSAINKTQKAIDKETTKLGRKGADILYDSGKNAGKGFLKGLEGQKKNIEKLMMDIAKAMQASIKKALGIKSPSTVMAKIGMHSTHGLARGLVQGMPVLDQALGAVSGRVAGRAVIAAGRAVIAPAAGRAAVVARGAGGTVVHIHVEGAVVDRLGAARAMQEAFLELKRNMGGLSLGLA